MKQEEEEEAEVKEGSTEVIEAEEKEEEAIEVSGGIEEEGVIMMTKSQDQNSITKKSQYLLLNPSLLIPTRPTEWVSLEEDEEEGLKTSIDSQPWAKINKLTKQ